MNPNISKEPLPLGSSGLSLTESARLPKVAMMKALCPLESFPSTHRFLMIALASGGAAILTACAPAQGPDKSIAGAVVGAAWGAGAGAVVGNQTGNQGDGALVGAGLGLVEGAATGLGLDASEEELLSQREVLADMKLHSAVTERQLKRIQARLDFPPAGLGAPQVYQLFFDQDGTNLKAGSAALLQTIARSIIANPYARKIIISGHSDDEGPKDYNEQLASSRARSVMGYLGQHGVALDSIKVESHGSERPLVSNATAEGRQLNRRVDIVVSP